MSKAEKTTTEELLAKAYKPAEDAMKLHPFYRGWLGTSPGLCPTAEAAYERIVSLPIYPGMSDLDVASDGLTVAYLDSHSHSDDYANSFPYFHSRTYSIATTGSTFT